MMRPAPLPNCAGGVVDFLLPAAWWLLLPWVAVSCSLALALPVLDWLSLRSYHFPAERFIELLRGYSSLARVP